MDGKPDIAVSNGSSNTIAVLLGNGDGTFQNPVVTNVQSAISTGELVTGDFNEDGKPDLILGTVSGPQIDLVFIGNGDGTFQAQVAIPNTFGFLDARVVDLNGDHHMDMIATVPGNSINVLLGNGDGTFTRKPDLQIGSGSTGFGMGIEAGDFNGDGKLDIVATDFANSQLDYFAGNGDGTFQASTLIAAINSQPDSVVSADFNHDGKQDLLIGYAVGSAFLALGNGDGTFGAESNLYAESGNGNGTGVSVKSADLNVDGKPDGMILDYGTGAFVVTPNVGNALAASSSTTYNTASGAAQMATGDLNRDGLPDVVIVNNRTNAVSVFLSQKN
jgi:hypothetical protein